MQNGKPSWWKIVYPQLKRNKEPAIRRKIEVFMEAHRLGNVTLACRRMGMPRTSYYRWWKRFEAAEFENL